MQTAVSKYNMSCYHPGTPCEVAMFLLSNLGIWYKKLATT